MVNDKEPQKRKQDKTKPVIKAIGFRRNKGGWSFYEYTIQDNIIVEIREEDPDVKVVAEETFKIAAVRNFFDAD